MTILYTSRIQGIAMTTFPLNAWYAAAYDVEVKAALLSRTDLRPEDRHVPAP